MAFDGTVHVKGVQLQAPASTVRGTSSNVAPALQGRLVPRVQLKSAFNLGNFLRPRLKFRTLFKFCISRS